MGDPGLASKFIEMQQEEAFAPRRADLPPNPYIEGLKMDRSRLQAEIERAMHVNHVAILRRALTEVERKLSRIRFNDPA